MTAAAVIRLEREAPQRFQVRWFELRNRDTLNMVKSGWAVYDGRRRITRTFPEKGEAEGHRDNIALIYARYGW